MPAIPEIEQLIEDYEATESPDTMIAELSDGRLLARNAIMNLLGQSAPIVVAVLAIPILIKSLGTDRFGILTLAWVVVGYFSLFDVDSACIDKIGCRKYGKGQTKEIPA